MDWQKVKKDLLLASSSYFFYKIAGYLVLTILTRYLAKDEMGEFFFATALVGFFALVTELGMNSYLVREVAGSPEGAPQYFSEVISLRLPLFAVYFLVINGFAFIFKPDLLMVIFLTSVYVFFDELYQSFGTLFLGLRRVAYNVIAGVSTRLLLVGLVFIVVTFKGSLDAIVACYILANALLVAIAFVIFWRKIGRLTLLWSNDSARRILSKSFPFFILTVLGLVHFKVDTMMLGFMKPYSVVATYEAAYKLFEASRFLILPIGMIFFPIFSEMAVRQNWQEIQTLLRKVLFVMATLGGVIALLVVATAGFIIPLVFGPKYNDSITILRVLFLSVPILYTAAVSTLLAKSIYLERKAVKIMSVCVILNVILNGIAIPFWGAVGAAWTTLITHIVLAVWLMKLNFQEFRVLCSTESVSILRKGLDYVE